jgi:hypothetical protein
MKKTYLLRFLLFSLSPGLLVSLSPGLHVNAQTLQFYREDIVFRLSHNTMETDAVYHFCNVGEKDIKTQLFYPFPDSTMELIDTIIINDMKTKQIIPYQKGHSGVFFGISVNAYGQASYRVFFRQRLAGQKFTYILTSTESWGRALEFANFELQVPENLKVNSLSYPPDTSFMKDNLQYYFWKKEDFMPERDFEVNFH